MSGGITKSCWACGSDIPKEALLCSICKERQDSLRLWTRIGQITASLLTVGSLVSLAYSGLSLALRTKQADILTRVSGCSRTSVSIILANVGEAPAFVYELKLIAVETKGKERREFNLVTKDTEGKISVGWIVNVGVPRDLTFNYSKGNGPILESLPKIADPNWLVSAFGKVSSSSDTKEGELQINQTSCATANSEA